MTVAVQLTLVIPCYNEAVSLPALVARCAEVFTRPNAEVILVDNGSTDATPAVIAELLGALDPRVAVRSIRIMPNAGYGGGILAGLAVAQGRILGWTHADLQTDVADALRALAVFEASDDPARLFVKGVRRRRKLGDAAFTAGMSVFETLLFQRPFWDVNAQPTLFARAHYDTWSGVPADFALDLFAYHAARTAGLSVRRIPVVFGARQHGQSHWNVDWPAKWRFIRRTVIFSLALRRASKSSRTSAPWS